MATANSKGLPLLEDATLRGLSVWGANLLTGAGFDEARLNAELLLAHAMRLTRTELEMQKSRPARPEETDAFRSLLFRRLAHEPLQYIVGKTEFMGYAIAVDHRVLIPRPETELLVERAIHMLRSTGREAPRILDIGTGSGCIAVALARSLPDSVVLGLDVSPDALSLAFENVRAHGIANVKLVQGNILENVFPGEAFDCVVSNPPYISAADFPGLQPEVRDFEPRVATTDEGDGLRFIRRIVAFARERLMPGGSVLTEIGFGQSGDVAAIFRATGFTDIRQAEDYAHVPRIVTGVQPATMRG